MSLQLGAFKKPNIQQDFRTSVTVSVPAVGHTSFCVYIFRI